MTHLLALLCFVQIPDSPSGDSRLTLVTTSFEMTMLVCHPEPEAKDPGISPIGSGFFGLSPQNDIFYFHRIARGRNLEHWTQIRAHFGITPEGA